MREILFRGKRTDNHQWVEGHYIVDDMENPNPYIVNRWKHRVAHKTVGQYTGLKDKNGICAWEHDITEDQFGRRWIIFRCAGGFGICRDTEWVFNTPIIYHALSDAQNAIWFSACHKIIGNIHDNPELIGEENG